MSDHETFPGSISGTYLHVDAEGPWQLENYSSPLALRYSVLYLLPKGNFAWFYYWSGYHYGRHVGRFARTGAVVQLDGLDSVYCDTPDLNYTRRPFQCQVRLEPRGGQRVMVGLSEKEHLFIGWGIYIPFHGMGQDLFPKSWAELDGWIARYLTPKIGS